MYADTISVCTCYVLVLLRSSLPLFRTNIPGASFQITTWTAATPPPPVF